MKESKASCPSWCEGQGDPSVHHMTPTHVGKTFRAGAASSGIEQLVEDDPENGKDVRFEILASLWYDGNGAIGELVAIDCRDIATVMLQVADQMDELARGKGVVYSR